MRSSSTIIWNMLRRHISSPYLFLWRTVELLASSDLVRAAFGTDDVAPGLRRDLDASLAHEHYYDAESVTRRLEALGLEVLAAAPYMAPRQACRWIGLRAYQARHPRHGLRGRLAQLRRIPATLYTLPLLRPVLATPEIGAGLAVV